MDRKPIIGIFTRLMAGLLLFSAAAALAQDPIPNPSAKRKRQEPVPTAETALHPTIILGRPTDTGVTARVMAPSPAQVIIEYGESAGVYTHKTAAVNASREQPATLVLNGLAPATCCYYRLGYTRDRPEASGYTGEYSFMTARGPGEQFGFVIQSDSHLLNKADKPVYARAMREMASLQPDFMFDLGDTFLNDKDPGIPRADVDDIAYQQVPYLDIVARSAPLFLVIGNHEGEYGYLLDGTPDNLSVYAALSRKQYYPNPVPDAFYSGNSTAEPFIGLPENYYAFTWGDALFVALDPYRYTVKDPSATRDGWDWTLGEAQYRWLKRTLEGNAAKFKLVFAHHAIGNIRGGARVAGLYEWGGADNRGRDLFAQKRPGWETPIHRLMRDTGVTIFFQGHDHVFARENVDGVIYQTLPKPAEVIPDEQQNRQYYEGADVQINSGYLHVRVAPERVQVDYRRTVVAGQPRSGSIGVVHSYTVDAAGSLTVLKRTDDSAAFEAYERAGRPKPRDAIRDRKETSGRKNDSEAAARAGASGCRGQDRIEPSASLHARPLLGNPTHAGISIGTASRNGRQVGREEADFIVDLGDIGAVPTPAHPARSACPGKKVRGRPAVLDSPAPLQKEELSMKEEDTKQTTLSG